MSNKVDYKSNKTPDNYRCSVCGKGNRKMWRQYNTIASAIELLCVDDALADQGVSYKVDKSGRHESDLGKSDQIEWLVPAVPTEENDTYWGYTSVPQDGVDWWHRLPLR